MKLLLLIGVFAAIQLDYFFIGSIAQQLHLYTGFLLIALLTIHKRHSQAILAAVLYGLMLDLIIIEVPFGVLTIAYILVFMIINSQANIALSVSRNLYIAVIFFSLLAYSAAIELIIFYSSNFLSASNFIFDSYAFFESIIISSLISTLFVVGMGIMASIFKSNLRKWFFVR